MADRICVIRQLSDYHGGRRRLDLLGEHEPRANTLIGALEEDGGTIVVAELEFLAAATEVDRVPLLLLSGRRKRAERGKQGVRHTYRDRRLHHALQQYTTPILGRAALAAAPSLCRASPRPPCRRTFIRRLDAGHPEDRHEERHHADQRVLDHLDDGGDLFGLLARGSPRPPRPPRLRRRCPRSRRPDYRVHAGPADAHRHQDHHRHDGAISTPAGPSRPGRRAPPFPVGRSAGPPRESGGCRWSPWSLHAAHRVPAGVGVAGEVRARAPCASP